MSRYWEALGSVRDEVLKLHVERLEAHDSMLAFAKRHGAEQYAIRESWGVSFALIFKTPPDVKLWKACRNSQECYEPKVSSKEGKLLAKEMRDIVASCPCGTDINKAIGFNDWFQGNKWVTSGYSIIGKRVLIVTADSYSPPEELSKLMKRISDTMYEKLTESKKRKINAK
jgi:hypothetical protein